MNPEDKNLIRSIKPFYNHYGVDLSRVDQHRKPHITRAMREFVMKRDGNKCRWCGKTENLEIDHSLAVSSGGEDNCYNLQVLCHSCHQDKHWSDRHGIP